MGRGEMGAIAFMAIVVTVVIGIPVGYIAWRPNYLDNERDVLTHFGFTLTRAEVPIGQTLVIEDFNEFVRDARELGVKEIGWEPKEHWSFQMPYLWFEYQGVIFKHHKYLLG